MHNLNRQEAGLEEALTQYKRRAKNANKLTPTKLLCYTAAASSAFVFSAAADAAVIYSGVQNIGLDTPVDINGDGTDDIAMTVSSSTGTSYNSNTASLITPTNGGVNGFIKISTSNGNVKKLSAGDTISAGALFNFGAGEFRNATSYATSSGSTGSGTRGSWSGAPGSSGFAGLKISDGPTDIFAWLRFSVSNDAKGFPVDVTLIDWAYEDTGASILAGQTVSAVPLPGSLGLLAMGVSGLAAFRRRKKSDKSSI